MHFRGQDFLLLVLQPPPNPPTKVAGKFISEFEL